MRHDQQRLWQHHTHTHNHQALALGQMYCLGHIHCLEHMQCMQTLPAACPATCCNREMLEHARPPGTGLACASADLRSPQPEWQDAVAQQLLDSTRAATTAAFIDTIHTLCHDIAITPSTTCSVPPSLCAPATLQTKAATPWCLVSPTHPHSAAHKQQLTQRKAIKDRAVHDACEFLGQLGPNRSPQSLAKGFPRARFSAERLSHKKPPRIKTPHATDSPGYCLQFHLAEDTKRNPRKKETGRAALLACNRSSPLLLSMVCLASIHATG